MADGYDPTHKPKEHHPVTYKIDSGTVTVVPEGTVSHVCKLTDAETMECVIPEFGNISIGTLVRVKN